MYFILKKEKGFTIIELVISIFILSIAIVGIFSAFSIITILTSDSADRLTATYLAQEGMEIVRNIRDTNWLNMDVCATLPPGAPGIGNISCPASWVDGLTSEGDNNIINCDTQGCEADYTSKYMSSYAAGSYLYLNANNFYDYNISPTKTSFEREITITPKTDVDNNSLSKHIIKVTVRVSWNEKATIINPGISADYRDSNGNCSPKNCITAEGTLYDWYNYPSSAKDITSFSFGINGENDVINPGTIAISVPYGTPGLDTAVADFTTTGNSITVGTTPQISGVTENDFTNPVTYTVTAANNTTQDYVVTVTVAPE